MKFESITLYRLTARVQHGVAVNASSGFALGLANCFAPRATSNPTNSWIAAVTTTDLANPAPPCPESNIHQLDGESSCKPLTALRIKLQLPEMSMVPFNTEIHKNYIAFTFGVRGL